MQKIVKLQKRSIIIWFSNHYDYASFRSKSTIVQSWSYCLLGNLTSLAQGHYRAEVAIDLSFQCLAIMLPLQMSHVMGKSDFSHMQKQRRISAVSLLYSQLEPLFSLYALQKLAQAIYRDFLTFKN